MTLASQSTALMAFMLLVGLASAVAAPTYPPTYPSPSPSYSPSPYPPSYSPAPSPSASPSPSPILIPPVPSVVPATSRNAGDTWVVLPMWVHLVLSSSGCATIAANGVVFAYQFQDSTAGAWNATTSANVGLAIQAGDVTVTSQPGCNANSRLRMLLQGGQSADVTALVNMASNVNQATISAYLAGFNVAATSAYVDGSFGLLFGVTSTTITFSPLQTASLPSNKSRALALGLGIGLGLGIPLLCGAAFLAYYLHKRRAEQQVGPTASPAGV